MAASSLSPPPPMRPLRSPKCPQANIKLGLAPACNRQEQVQLDIWPRPLSALGAPTDPHGGPTERPRRPSPEKVSQPRKGFPIQKEVPSPGKGFPVQKKVSQPRKRKTKQKGKRSLERAPARQGDLPLGGRLRAPRTKRAVAFFFLFH